MVRDLNEAFSNFDLAYSNLFLEDLPNYLAQFDWHRRIAPSVSFKNLNFIKCYVP